MSDLLYKVMLANDKGVAIKNFEVRIQEGISLKLAKAIAAEILPKKLLTAIDEALVAEFNGAKLAAAAAKGGK